MSEMKSDKSWGGRAAGTFAAVLLLLVSSSLFIGHGASVVRPAIAAMTAPTVGSAHTEQAATAVPNETTTSLPQAATRPVDTYDITAIEGDSLTTLYRRALGLRLADLRTDIEDSRKIYVEDGMAKAHYRPYVYVGDVVTAEAAEIDGFIGESADLTPEQKTGLDDYARQAGL